MAKNRNIPGFKTRLGQQAIAKGYGAHLKHVKPDYRTQPVVNRPWPNEWAELENPARWFIPNPDINMGAMAANKLAMRMDKQLNRERISGVKTGCNCPRCDQQRLMHRKLNAGPHTMMRIEMQRQRAEMMRLAMPMQIMDRPPVFLKDRLILDDIEVTSFKLPAPVPPPAKRLADGDIDTYKRYLVSIGYKLIGSGNWSAVYRFGESDRVIKVARQPLRGQGSPDYWPMFAKYIQQFDSPYVLKVYSIKHYKEFYVASIEAIDTIGNDIDEDESDIRQFFDKIGRYAERDKLLGAKKESNFRALGVNAQREYINSKYPGLMAYIRMLRQKDMVQDLHSGNWGLRADGTPVIMDPMCSLDKRAKPYAAKYNQTYRFRRAA